MLAKLTHWLRFTAAAILGASVMTYAEAPWETIVAGIAVAGGVTYVRQLLARG
jgi:uncharacterized membrane protein YjjP (DUF1212 family)